MRFNDFHCMLTVPICLNIVWTHRWVVWFLYQEASRYRLVDPVLGVDLTSFKILQVVVAQPALGSFPREFGWSCNELSKDCFPNQGLSQWSSSTYRIVTSTRFLDCQAVTSRIYHPHLILGYLKFNLPRWLPALRPTPLRQVPVLDAAPFCDLRCPDPDGPAPMGYRPQQNAPGEWQCTPDYTGDWNASMMSWMPPWCRHSIGWRWWRVFWWFC